MLQERQLVISEVLHVLQVPAQGKHFDFAKTNPSLQTSHEVKDVLQSIQLLTVQGEHPDPLTA